MDFLKWYKNRIESNEPELPSDTWDNIRDQLDIDSSWQAIDRHLNNKAVKIMTFRTVAAAGLLLFIMAGIYRGFMANDDETNRQVISENISDESHQHAQSEEIKHDVPGEERTAAAEKSAAPVEERAAAAEKKAAQTAEKAAEAEKKAAQTAEKAGDSKTLFSSPGNRDRERYADQVRHKENIMKRAQLALATLEPSEPGLAVPSFETKTDILIPADPYGSYPQKNTAPKNRAAFRKFYIGTTGQLSNTWLMNDKTASAFKSTSLVSTNASYGSNFGIYTGTNLLDHLDLQLDLNILTTNKQEYNEYRNGHYITNDMLFNYSQLAMSFRYYLNSSKFMEGEHGVNFGAYMAYLHNAIQQIEGQSLYISNNYNDLDYGLVLAYEYIFPLHGSLGIGTGFRAYYGLNNIYAGNENIPSYLNVTSNASVNITLSLKYKLY